jgi:hypothetical protein
LLSVPAAPTGVRIRRVVVAVAIRRRLIVAAVILRRSLWRTLIGLPVVVPNRITILILLPDDSATLLGGQPCQTAPFEEIVDVVVTEQSPALLDGQSSQAATLQYVCPVIAVN